MEYPMNFYRKCLSSDKSNPKERRFVISLLMHIYIPIKPIQCSQASYSPATAALHSAANQWNWVFMDLHTCHCRVSHSPAMRHTQLA